MKALKLISIEYRLGEFLRKFTLGSNPGIEEIMLTGPGMAEIHYTDGLVDMIVSDQMVITVKPDTSKIETIDMGIASVS